MKKFFRWVFKKELVELESTIKNINEVIQKYDNTEKKLKNVLGNIDVSVDVHQYSRSWACISIQGQKSDYIKFVDLGEAEIREIASFLRNFDRDKVDATPSVTQFIRMEKSRF